MKMDGNPLTNRLGRRGAFLLLLGLLWCAIGYARLSGLASADGTFLQGLPNWARGSAWLATGLVSAAYAWAPPRFPDAIGFVALYIMPLITGGAYIVGWLMWIIGDNGLPTGWLGAAFWFGFVVVIQIVAGWVEPTPPLPVGEVAE